MKRFLIILALVAAVLLAGVASVPFFIDREQIKKTVLEQVADKTGYDVVIEGGFNISLLPTPHVSIEDLYLRLVDGSELLSLDKAAVSIALLPLLKGEINLGSVQLVKPVIHVTQTADGLNWITPEIKSLTNGNGQAKSAESGEAKGFVLENASIKQGTVIYKAQGKPAIEIKDINTDLTADSLEGPFVVSGGLTYVGKNIVFEASTGRIGSGVDSVALNLKAGLSDNTARLEYAGVVGLKAPFEVQGETALEVIDLRAFAGASDTAGMPKISVKTQGLLTYAANVADYKNMTLSLAGQKLSGMLNADLEKSRISMKLKGNDIFEADKFIASIKQQKTETSKDTKTLKVVLLPDTVALPVAYDLNLEIALEQLLYRGEVYKNIGFTMLKEGNDVDTQLSVAALPGQGSLKAFASLVFESKSKSADGAEIFSEPVLNVNYDISTKNLPFTVQALAPAQGRQVWANWLEAGLQGSLSVTPHEMTLELNNLRLDANRFTVAGAYKKGNQNGARDKLSVDIETDVFNYDSFFANLKPEAPVVETEQKPALTDTLSTTAALLALPFDLDISATAKNLQAFSHKVSGFQAAMKLKENELSALTVKGSDVAGASFTFQGSVGDLKALKKADLRLYGQSSDIYKSLKGANVEKIDALKNIKALTFDVSARGDTESVDVNLGLKAMNGEILGQGKVVTPLAKSVLENVNLQIKHPNLADLLLALKPEGERVKPLSKPLDVYTQIVHGENGYDLENLKADIAGIAVEGELTVNDSAPKLLISGELRSGDIMLATNRQGQQTERIQAQKRTKTNSGTQNTKWQREALDMSGLHAVNLDLKVAAKSFVNDAVSLDKPVAQIKLQNGKLDISNFSAGIWGGSISAATNIIAQEDSRQPIKTTLKAQLRNVELDDIASYGKAAGYIGASGKIGADVDVKSSGVSQAALIYDLSGKAQLSGEDIVLKGIDLTKFARALSDKTKPGDTLQELWNGASKGGSSHFDVLDGEFNIAEGIVNISKLDLDGPAAHLGTTGTVNLPLWRLDTEHKVTLKQDTDVPPFTMKISGPLDRPAQTFGQGALQDYLTRKLERKLEGLLIEKLGLPGTSSSTPANDNGNGTPQTQEPRTERINPEEAIKGLLKGILQ